MKLPGLQGKSQVISKFHDTGDIIELVLNQDGRFQDQTNKFTEKLKGLTLNDQCKYIWQTLRDNVTYKADTPFKQDLKSPARLFSDGVGDCKSFSLFEASCLRNLNIPYAYRFVSFNQAQTPTHVYILAMPGTSKEIIMDGVLPKFDYQKPFTYKHDVVMPLSMLTGVGDIFSDFGNTVKKVATDVAHSVQVNTTNAVAYVADPKKLATDLAHSAAVNVANLQKSAIVNAANLKKTADAVKHSIDVNAANAKAYADNPAKLAADANKSLQNILAVVAKINPATALIRLGILTTLGLNFFNSASQLKLGYLTPAQAQARGYNMTEWNKLQQGLTNFIKVYTTTWGGSAAELKDAILKGGGSITGSSIGNACIGQLETVAIASAVVAAIPIILSVLKSLGVDFGAMTKGGTQGSDEKNAQKPSTLTDLQLQELAAGAAKLAADTAAGADPDVIAADAFALAQKTASSLPGNSPSGQSSSTYPPTPYPPYTPPPPAKKDNTLLYIGGAALAFYLYSKSK